MISNEGIESWLEAVYLGEPVTNRTGRADIQVNPKVPKYVVGKVVIITRPDYPVEGLTVLRDNLNKIISRVRLQDMTDISFQPYIIRVDFNITWNGDTVRLPQELRDDPELLRKELEDSIGLTETNKPAQVSFPKILGCPGDLVLDPSGNLTAIGWALHQVGVNVKPSADFIDLDLLKTKKILLE